MLLEPSLACLEPGQVLHTLPVIEEALGDAPPRMKYINTTLAASGQRRSYHASSSGSLGNCLHNLVICLTQFPICWHVCHRLQRSFRGAVSLAILQGLAPTEKREFLLVLPLRRRQNLAVLHCGWQQQMILICRLLHHSLANAVFFSKCKKPWAG